MYGSNPFSGSSNEHDFSGSSNEYDFSGNRGGAQSNRKTKKNSHPKWNCATAAKLWKRRRIAEATHRRLGDVESVLVAQKLAKDYDNVDVSGVSIFDKSALFTFDFGGTYKR